MALTSAEKSKLYRQRYPGVASQVSQRWRENHPGYGAEWRAAHSEYGRVYASQYYKEHKGDVLLREKNQRCRQVIDAQQVLGGKCVVCGLDIPAVLQFDHINNDGKQHRDEGTAGHANGSLARWILLNPEEARGRIQLLCANCHVLKHSRFQNCPAYGYMGSSVA